MNVIKPKPIRGKAEHGRPYMLQEFATKYGLDPDEAVRLYVKFGPSSIDLDLLMRGKSLHPTC